MGNNQPIPGSAPQGFYSPPKAAAPPKPQREYTGVERALLPAALAVAVLFDRLLVTTAWNTPTHLPFASAVFWLLFLAVYYIVFWKKLKSRRMLWGITALTGLLCAWNFLFDYRSEYGALSVLVVPAVLMAHTQFLAGDYRYKEVGRIAQAWIMGWLVKPFIAIPHFAGSAGSVLSGGKQAQLKKAAIGVGIALPLLLVIVPLLGSADLVFAYYLHRLLQSFRISSFVVHLLVVALAVTLFYSFLWCIGFGGTGKADAATTAKQLQVDVLISCIVLGSVALVYALFCGVQFTYLFARAGLPGDMTYSEYAREGFAQMVLVCSINLLLFGAFLQYGKRHKAVTALLGALLVMTGVLLVSSLMRLRLYIATYGLTWLRLLSGWFILYLIVVLALCALRMVKPSIPLIATCAVLLLGWYVALGYCNPDALIVRHNLRTAPDHAAWVDTNRSYVTTLSDNAMLTLFESDVDGTELTVILDSQSGHGQAYNLSSYILQNRLPG